MEGDNRRREEARLQQQQEEAERERRQQDLERKLVALRLAREMVQGRPWRRAEATSRRALQARHVHQLGMAGIACYACMLGAQASV